MDTYGHKMKLIAINGNAIQLRIDALQLKKYWLADRMKVHPRTLTRWTTGKVKYMRESHAELLAKFLQCAVTDFVSIGSLESSGTKQDKQNALQSMFSEDLLALLSPTGNWELIENIIFSVVGPQTEQVFLGKLYNWASITKWRRGYYKEAIEFANRALDIGKKIDDSAVVYKAYSNLGTVYSILGKLPSAIEFLEKCYADRGYLESIKDIATVCNNLAMSYRDGGYIQKALEIQEEAIKLYELEKLTFNLSIAYLCKGFYLAESKKLQEALAAFERSKDYAEQSNYRVGRLLPSIYTLDVIVQQDPVQDLEDETRLAVETLMAENISDPYCYEMAARYYRIRNMDQQSERIIQKGLLHAEDMPVVIAGLLLERSRLKKKQQAFALYDDFFSKAMKIYDSSGAYGRITGEVREFPYLNSTR